MATAPVSRKLNLTRDQLAAFLTDQQQIKQFELLFSTVDTLQVIVGTDFEFQADNAAATANEALTQINALAQVVDLNGQAEALSCLAEISKRIQSLESAPPFSAPPAVTPASPTTSVQFNNGGAFGGSANFTWTPTTFTVGPAGGTVSITTTAPTSSQTAALLRFSGRNAAQANGNGGGFIFLAGTGLGTGSGGAFSVSTGQCTNGQGGNITFTTGGSTNNLGGNMSFTSGQGGVLGGALTFNSGNGIGVNGTGGDFTMLSGDGRGSGTGGNYLLTAGNNTDFIGSGGNFFLLPGYGGTTGSIYLQTPNAGDAIQITDNTTSAQIGFFGATPVSKPTAVPVTAAGIHAALVSLGLIS